MKLRLAGILAACAIAGLAIAAPYILRSPSSQPPFDELQALRTLPYASWSGPLPPEDSGRSGVVGHDERSSWPGLNTFISAGNVVVMDMQGRETHRVSVAPSRVTNMPTFKPLDGGRFLAATPGLVLVDWNGQEIWRIKKGNFHHDIAIGDDGTIFALDDERATIEGLDPAGEVVDNNLVRISPGGEVLSRSSFGQAIARHPRLSARARAILARERDIAHINALEPVRHDITKDGQPFLAKGDMIFCSRTLEVIGAIRPSSGEIVWAWGERELGMPHSPRLLADGTIAIFDNGGFKRRYSRIVLLDPVTERVVWIYQATPKEAFFSPAQGYIQELPNGNLLITESERGRAFELTRKGEVVWDYFNPVTKVTEEAGRKSVSRATIPLMFRLTEPGLPAERTGAPLPSE